MPPFSTPACLVFLVCCLCTMVNYSQPNKKLAKTANSERRRMKHVASITEEFIVGGQEGPRLLI